MKASEYVKVVEKDKEYNMPDITLKEMMTGITAQQKLRGVVYSEMTADQRIKYASECAHALLVEAAELSSSWPFASWKTTPIDRENIEREIIDCVFFLVNIASSFYITPEKLQDRYEWVLANNLRRIENGEHQEVELK